MRFTIVYRGRIPASGAPAQIAGIRADQYLQGQLAALYAVTRSQFSAGNKQIIAGTRYTAILPITWMCAVEIILLRATPAAQISGLPDLDNTLKTLFDAICAPAGAGQLPTSVAASDLFVLAIEDKQLSPVTASADHHWTSSSNEDMAIIRVTTQETPIDDAVALGGQSFKALRKNVF